jgi:hypothetical protein
VPLRQYVLAMPPELHHRLARNADLETQALAAFLAELGDHLRATAGADGERGFVTFIQHFGSTLNLHVHFHVLALEGVYVRAGEAAPTFRRAREPTQAELEALVAAAAQRIRKLTGRSDADEVPAVEAPLLKLIGAEPVELELPEKRLTAEHDGFNLRAATAFEEHEHDAIERFPRKGMQVPVSLRCARAARAQPALAGEQRPSRLPAQGAARRWHHARRLLAALVPDALELAPRAAAEPPDPLPWGACSEPRLAEPDRAQAAGEAGAGAPPAQRARLGLPAAPRFCYRGAALLVLWWRSPRDRGHQGRTRCATDPRSSRPADPRPKPAQRSLFPTGPAAVDEPEASGSDADYDQRLPDSEQFA